MYKTPWQSQLIDDELYEGGASSADVWSSDGCLQRVWEDSPFSPANNFLSYFSPFNFLTPFFHQFHHFHIPLFTPLILKASPSINHHSPVFCFKKEKKNHKFQIWIDQSYITPTFNHNTHSATLFHLLWHGLHYMSHEKIHTSVKIQHLPSFLPSQHHNFWIIQNTI